jgi:hypothetical protein
MCFSGKPLSVIGCFLLAGICRSQTIPLRDQALGESRPSWWISCWAGNVVVIKGVLRFEVHDPPDLELKLSPNALLTHFPNEKERQFADTVSRFCIGTVNIDEMLFASPGIEYLNTRIARMRDGNLRSIKALVMAMQHQNRPPFFFNVKPGVDNKGVFIFRSEEVVPSVSLVFDEPIPEEQLPDAMAVFAYREKFDHHTHPVGHQPFKEETAEGVIGIGFFTKFPEIEHVMEESPAAKAGIHSGDQVVRIGQLDTSGMSVTEFLRAAAVLLALLWN